MPTNNTLFGERTVSIPDNPTLATQCNHILRLVDADKSLLDGVKMGAIYRKIVWAVWMDNGLKGAFQEGFESLQDFLFDTKKAASYDTVTRAIRWLIEKDYIRVSSAAMKESFNQEKRLAVAFKK